MDYRAAKVCQAQKVPKVEWVSAALTGKSVRLGNAASEGNVDLTVVAATWAVEVCRV